MSRETSAPVGVFGGTFNPVHYGHLRSAVELLERLGLSELRLMPSASPPLRDEPTCSAEHRAAMVELAVKGEPGLVCDQRELMRSGKSYTIDSLIEIREELGSQRSFCMVLGFDALLKIDRWHRWDELLNWAHVVVIARPGWTLPQDGPVARWLAEHRLMSPQQLREAPAGGVLVEELRPLDISATEVRDLIRAGRSVRYLMPHAVLRYIETHQLYRDNATPRDEPL